ncbi:hypothetical protein A5724_26295 [Mycobacterium sp. ACS1612]|uniref:Rv1733c family protein n=1 Tax=Mycobacterium sp. ACS1612 TaxID=1834117 RepID=UPI0007FEC267|nr:hypothetical protein [Mycobacterium sp. ACS1612]OBF28926.1 hypothetical protein A5724_26295 [Mycobacterium sp. ACS1612]
MQWLTVSWWRWRLAQARGRNPLVRSSDRVEVAVLAVAVVALLAVIPFAGAVGTAVHDEHAKMYAEQNLDRHRVAATATADSKPNPRGTAARVEARWQAGDIETAGLVTYRAPVKDGSQVDIWVDKDGRQVSPPAQSWQAGADAVVAAVGLWLCAAGIAALVVALVRGGLRHARYNAWNREIVDLVREDGRTGRR